MASIQVHARKRMFAARANARVSAHVHPSPNHEAFCVLTITADGVEYELFLAAAAQSMAQVAADALNDAFALAAKQEPANA